MISQTAEYALRAVLCMAARAEIPLTTKRIAEVTQVPAGYLCKVLRGLGRAGLVVSRPGLHGGFALGRPAEKISLLDVVNAVGGVRRIRECPLGLGAHGRNLCALHRRLDRAAALVEQTFSEATIAELRAEPSASKPFCEVQPHGSNGPAPGQRRTRRSFEQYGRSRAKGRSILKTFG